MKVHQVVILCALVALAYSEEAVNCIKDKCKLPNCLCSDLIAPLGGDIPQFVALSFDDSAAKLIYDEFYSKELFHRKNPDGCPISGTFFVPHEYSDYTVVNALYNKGWEIGSHSITKNFSTSYWNSASEDTIVKEMGGQRTVISKFANIPKTDIIGARIPHFQLNAENTFKGLKKAGFQYDSSWPTYSFRPLFPYTLDYKSEQPCLVGSCPKESIPGIWIQPIINWVDKDNVQCNKLLACAIEGTGKQIFEWMKTNFERNYKDKKAPVSIIINYAWLTFTKNSGEALTLFFDYLATLKDVFIVSENQLLKWMQKPVPLKSFSSCQSERHASCSPRSCRLTNDEGLDRYMGSCVECPKNYPVPGNPEGA